MPQLFIPRLPEGSGETGVDFRVSRDPLLPELLGRNRPLQRALPEAQEPRGERLVWQGCKRE